MEPLNGDCFAGSWSPLSFVSQFAGAAELTSVPLIYRLYCPKKPGTNDVWRSQWPSYSALGMLPEDLKQQQHCSGSVSWDDSAGSVLLPRPKKPGSFSTVGLYSSTGLYRKDLYSHRERMGWVPFWAWFPLRSSKFPIVTVTSGCAH